MESSHKIISGTLLKFSEQQLLDCAASPNLGCTSGNATDAFDYYLKNRCSLESDYPYNAQ
jgi:cathepsin L